MTFTIPNPAVFRAYDIRGIADADLTDSMVEALGGAFSSFIGAGARIAVGRDCRLTSDRLFAALTRGLVAAGAHVIDIGVVPSPVLYFAAHHLATDGAIIITGSHNPAPDNGFKLMRGTTVIHSEDIASLRDRIEREDIDSGPAPGSMASTDIQDDYIERAKSGLNLGPRRFPVVVDAGNGAGGPLAVRLYRELGFEVEPLYCDMDGRFPAHHPDPTVEANLADLKAKVIETSAEVGLALDGDGDRLGAIDGRGRVLWGDQLMQLFGKDIAGKHPGATIIAEVKCSQHLFDQLKAHGANAIMWKVGHSYIKAKMKESGALLAGEMSGHLFFADRYLGFDDGVYAGARLLELLSHTPTTLAELFDQLPVSVATPEMRVDCDDASKFDVVARAGAALRQAAGVLDVVDIDGVRARFEDGWGLIRASNTQPVLVLRAEASDDAGLAKIVKVLEDIVESSKELS